MGLNSEVPRIVKLDTVTFKPGETNKTINMLTGEGYLGLILVAYATYISSGFVDYFNPSDFLWRASSDHFNNCLFEIRRDGYTIIQHSGYDFVHAPTLLTHSLSNFEGSNISNYSGLVIPMSPVVCFSNNSPEYLCSSTIDVKSLSLNINLPEFTNQDTILTFECYGVIISTNKHFSERYLFTERIEGNTGDVLSGFNTQQDGFIYGYSYSFSSINPGADFFNNGGDISFYLRTQGKIIVNEASIFSLAGHNILTNSNVSFVNFSANNDYAFNGSFNTNITNKWGSGIKTRQIDDTQFRFTPKGTSIGPDSRMSVTHYQMRGR